HGSPQPLHGPRTCSGAGPVPVPARREAVCATVPTRGQHNRRRGRRGGTGTDDDHLSAPYGPRPGPGGRPHRAHRPVRLHDGRFRRDEPVPGGRCVHLPVRRRGRRGRAPGRRGGSASVAALKSAERATGAAGSARVESTTIMGSLISMKATGVLSWSDGLTGTLTLTYTGGSVADAMRRLGSTSMEARYLPDAYYARMGDAFAAQAGGR